MKERLRLYQERNKTLPKKVIVFRDGVSEGQFEAVLEEELPGIRKAFRAFQSYKPKLTIAVCRKRHHTRFFPMDPVVRCCEPLRDVKVHM